MLAPEVRADAALQHRVARKLRVERGAIDGVVEAPTLATGRRALDDELRHLHSGAVALLLPSACEGFGLPAVEAAACGAAVIATTASPLPELLAGGGEFVPPADAGALEAAMRRLLNDEPYRRGLAATARVRAQARSWDRGAAAALAALREAAA